MIRARRPPGLRRRVLRHQGRLWIFIAVTVALMGTLLGRLGMVQLVQHVDYAQQAASINTRVVRQPAVRGRILAADGTALVDNDSSAAVTVDRATLLSQPDGGKALIARVATLLGMPFAPLWGRAHLCGTPGAPEPPACFNGSPYAPIPIVTGADPRRALSLLERPESFPGIGVVAEPERHYPHPDQVNAAQLLGYLGRTTQAEVAASGGALGADDLVGRAGLEAQYNSVLRGSDGLTTVAIDPRGVVTRRVSRTDPAPGNDIVTHLDPSLQSVTEKALAAAMAKAGRTAKGVATGAAVVLDTASGAVLASASYPTYRPEVWTGGISTKDLTRLSSDQAGTPLANRVTSRLFPPASTFKVISLPAAIRSGVSVKGKYDCPSSLRIGDRTFHNFESDAYGMITLRRALVVSCDTIFYRFAYDSWLKQGGVDATSDAGDPFVLMAHEFGLGRPTGVDLPGEAAGRIPDRAWKRAEWERTKAETCARAKSGYPEVTDRTRADYLLSLAIENCQNGFEYRGGDAVNFAIGQGDVAVTPLQMAVVYSAIANGGVLWTPQVAAAVHTPSGATVTTFAPKSAGHVDLAPQTLALLRSGLQGVMTEGTASAAFKGFPLDRYPLAGKTGTAEVFGQNATAWFASYGPVPKPRYAVVVVIGQGGQGGQAAAPVARRIWQSLRARP